VRVHGDLLAHFRQSYPPQCDVGWWKCFRIDSASRYGVDRADEGFEMTGFTIGKVAKAAGVGVETIRFYEKKGLIVQPVAQGTYRVYQQSVVARIRFIRRAKEIGFQLSEIKELLTLADHSEYDRGAVKDIASRKAETLRERIAQLKKAEQTLLELVDNCSGEGTVEGCPIIEALIDDGFGKGN